MPSKDILGSQRPIELSYDFWYDRQSIVQNNIKELQELLAMGEPGGGKAVISTPILSKFNLINY